MQPVQEKTVPVRVPNGDHLRGMVKILRNLLPLTVEEMTRLLTFRVDRSAIVGASQREIEVIRVWREDGDAFYLPRQFFAKLVFSQLAYSHYAEAVTNGFIEEELAEGEPADWQMKPNFRFRRSAKCDQEEAVRVLSETASGSLRCFPAAGKTVMALAAAARRKRRTLVVVPTVALIDQWIARALLHTTLQREEIGVVQGTTCEWDRPLIVGTVQSLASHAYPKMLYSRVGVTIWDEQHRMSAPHFSEAMMLFPSLVRWGLSATIERRDGLHKIFEYHVGKVVYEMREQETPAQISILRTGIHFEEHAYQNPWNRRFNHSRMLNSIAKNEARNRMLAAEIAKAYKAGRKILALTHRLGQMDRIFQLLVTHMDAGAIGFIRGSTSVEERRRVLAEAKVILAVYQIAGFALDEPTLDTLFCLTPSQDVEQYVGRIQREHPDKKEPLVVDPVDNAEPLAGLAGARAKVYKKLGFEVNYVSLR